MIFQTHLDPRWRKLASLRLPPFILVVLLLIGSALLAPPASAATAPIQVLSDRWSIAFPDEVEFTLEAQADVLIEEVRIYYQVPGQGVTTYSYPEFAPGKRIRATFFLPTAGPDYVPPGTEVEYYYVLQDTLGTTLTTERHSFLYQDTRYAWQMTRIGPLELYWHGRLTGDLASVPPGIESALERIESVLQVKPERPLRGFIYNSQSEAASAFPPLSATLQQEHLFAGYAFPDKGLFLGVGSARYLVVHECAHLYLGQLLGFAHPLLPAWVDEGFAVYMQEPSRGYEDFASRLRREELLPLKAMGALPGQTAQIRIFYDQAPAVVGYLLERHGAERFRTFLGQFKQGDNTEEALQAAYGFGVEELDSLWKDVTGAFGEKRFDARFWAMVVPSGVIVLVLLVAITAYAVRYVRRTRRGTQKS